MDPPIHTEYFLSGGAMILILMVDGAKAVISFCILSATPGDMVVPPDMTVLAYKSLRMSTSHHDGVVGGLMDTAGFHSQEGWSEEGFWGTETFVANGDDLSIGQFVGFLQGGGGSSGGHFLFEVKGNIAELFLDVTDDFTFGGGGERVTSLGEDLHEVVGELTSSQVQTEDGVWESITFIDGDGVGYTISRVHDNTSGTSRSIKGEDSLDGDIHGWHVEGFEHDLGHLFTVSLWVKWSFSQENGL